MPASPQRRTRRVAPAESADAVPGEVLGTVDAPVRKRRSSAQLRSVQSAVSDPKVRLPEDKRATESAGGKLTAAIKGKRFRLSESIGLMPLMQWAAANDEVDPGNLAQLASFYRVLKDLVHPEAWQEFCSYTTETKCGDTDFVAFQSAAVEAIAARPTGAPATS
jgi:hypothetical protein